MPPLNIRIYKSKKGMWFANTWQPNREISCLFSLNTWLDTKMPWNHLSMLPNLRPNFSEHHQHNRVLFHIKRYHLPFFSEDETQGRKLGLRMAPQKLKSSKSSTTYAAKHHPKERKLEAEQGVTSIAGEEEVAPDQATYQESPLEFRERSSSARRWGRSPEGVDCCNVWIRVMGRETKQSSIPPTALTSNSIPPLLWGTDWSINQSRNSSSYGL